MTFRMDFRTVFFGSLLVILGVIFTVVALPYLTFNPAPSDSARPLTDKEEEGRRIYASNGCFYCHSQFLRPQDWVAVNSYKVAGRPAQAGDYAYQKTMLLGTERTGPDLSQEGGSHPDDWHMAHFWNPRYTSMKSIMPQWNFWSPDETSAVIAYVQSLGGQPAVARAKRQADLKTYILAERAKPGPADDKDKYYREQLQQMFPASWKNVRNPMPPTVRSLEHGKYLFQQNCIGCHGPKADGHGPAAQFLDPKPFSFQDKTRQTYMSDGQLYDAILFGVAGTAMPSWGDILTVNDIWDITNFLRTIPEGSLEKDPTPQMLKWYYDYLKVPGPDLGLSESDQEPPTPQATPAGTPTPGR